MISCLSIRTIKKLIYETQKRKKKHNKTFYLGKNKADSVEMLISQAIIDLDISHEEFKTIINEKKTMMIKKMIINEGDKSKMSEIEIV